MRIRRVYTREEALSRMAAYCSSAEHCLSEVRAKLNVMQLTSGDIEIILDRLVDEGFVDEQRFCKAYVLDKMRYNGWGRNKISVMLAQKQVDKQAISDAIDSIEDDEYYGIMKQIVDNKRRSVSAKSAYERNAKLMRFALGRGFEMSLVSRYLNTIEETDEI